MAIPTLGTATTGTTGAVTSFAADLRTHSEGDLLLMFVQEGTGRTIIVSTWTTVATHAAPGAGSLGVYAKVAGASEGSTKTVSLNNSSACSYACVAVSGAADIGVTPIVAGTDGNAAAASARVVRLNFLMTRCPPRNCHDAGRARGGAPAER